MEAFSSYKVEITNTTGAHHTVNTTIADSLDLVHSSISEMWEVLYEYGNLNELLSFNGDDERKAHEVVGLTVEYCDDDDSNMSTNTKNKAATLQLCCGGIGILIQLLHLEEIPFILSNFLADDTDHVFVGLGIMDTLAMIERDYGLKCKSKIDLGPVASRICRKPQYFDSTLEVLARDIAEINIEKPTIPSLTLWGARNLRNEQIDYAMTKAYASYCIGNKLMKRDFQRI